MCADVREVFDLFDFWDGRDGMVDGAKVGDFLRCCGLNPTNAMVQANGGTKKLGRLVRGIDSNIVFELFSWVLSFLFDRLYE